MPFNRCLSGAPRALLLAFTITSACLLANGCAQFKNEFSEDMLFLTNVSVINVESGDVVGNQTIVVQDDQILDILPSNHVSSPPLEQVLETGGYVVPGLWDMHVHSMTVPDKAIEYFFPMFLANGVIGVRDMGSVVDGIIETRARLDADPSRLAPQLYVSGPLLDGQALPWYGDLPLVLNNAEEVERELPKLQAAGMDFFKVYDALPPEAYDAVIAYSRANSIPVAGHAPKGINLTGAALAGQRTIEHISPFGFRDCLANPEDWFRRAINAKFGQGYEVYYTVTQELFAALDRGTCGKVFEAMAKRGTRFTPTLVMELNDRSRTPADDLQYLHPSSLEWCEAGLSGIDQANTDLREAVYSEYGVLLQEMRSAGVTIIAGSDVPNNCLVPGFSLHWELARMVEVGLTPLEALQSATVHAAAVMDRSDETGQVLPGYAADLIVLEANPLDDVSNLKLIKGVLAKGRWIDEATRNEMLKVVLAEFESKAENSADMP